MAAEEDARERLLRLFRQAEGGVLSGAALSQTLGVSRTAVWKQISRLRAAGYAIEALPARGYRLLDSPDRLSPAEIRLDLATTRVGSEVLCFARTDSTNLRAIEHAERGGGDGSVLIAEEQTAGKGRMGRRWFSPAGLNLYLSLLLRPALPPFEAPRLTFVAAVAVAETLAARGVPVRVKWPNDLLIHGRKVGGILSEMRAEADRIHFVVLGIGVNLNMPADLFPPDLRAPATSLLLECGAPVNRLAFTRDLLRALDRWYARYLAAGFEPVRRAWEGYAEMSGTRVRVVEGVREFAGTVAGLTPEGALLVRRDDGPIETVWAGDVLLPEPGPEMET